MSNHKLNIKLFVSTQCPHCSQALELLTQAVKQADIAKLSIINLNANSSDENYSHIRSVPFIQINDYEFTGSLKKSELADWIKAENDNKFSHYYFSNLLADGSFNQVESFLKRKPNYWIELISLALDPENKMNIKIGITAIFESIASEIPKLSQCDDIINTLIQASETDNHAIRVDLIYFISLIYTALEEQQLMHAQLEVFMRKALQDVSDEVKEIADDVLTIKH